MMDEEDAWEQQQEEAYIQRMLQESEDEDEREARRQAEEDAEEAQPTRKRKKTDSTLKAKRKRTSKTTQSTLQITPDDMRAMCAAGAREIQPADVAAAAAAAAAAEGSEAAEAAAAAAATAPEQEIPPPQVVPMKELNWDEYIQDPDDPIEDPNFCLWCNYAVCARQAQKGNLRWQRLKIYHEENWGRVHPFKFARESQRLYNKYIRDHLTDDKGRQILRGPAWPAREIHEHPILHVFISRCAHTENATVYQNALRRIRDHGLFLSDGSVDAKLLKTYCETEKVARILYDKIDASKGSALFGFS